MSDDLVTVRANLPSERRPRNLKSPTNQRIGRRLVVYSHVRDGDILQVHRADQEARPALFVLAEAIDGVESLEATGGEPGETAVFAIADFSISQTAFDLAIANGVDLSKVEGTGKDGRILVKDVEAWVV